ncbi:hypothetical protein BDV06DRAFT_18506 [Aspergillus oleicola]
MPRPQREICQPRRRQRGQEPVRRCPITRSFVGVSYSADGWYERMAAFRSRRHEDEMQRRGRTILSRQVRTRTRTLCALVVTALTPSSRAAVP